jgi:HEAT repeat protein
MNDLERQVRERFLDRLCDGWDDEEPRLDFGSQALPHFIVAFLKEADPERRARLIRIIWQFRDRLALPTLALALKDSSPAVWEDALDGVVSLGGEKALEILREAAANHGSVDQTKAEWIQEAVDQVIHGTL